MEAFVIICFIVVLSHLFLSKLITGHAKVKLPENAKRFDLFGKIILSLIGMGTLLAVLSINGFEDNGLKWILIIMILLNFAFQSFLNWKFLKDYKGYIVSFSVLIIGVGLVNILL